MSVARRTLPGSSRFDPLAPARLARRQIGLRRVAAWAIRGSLAGGIAAAFLLATAVLWSLPAALPLAAAALLVGVLAGAGIGVARWPDTLEAARTVDRRFSLHDRLTTALELRGSELPLAAIQRADTGRRLSGLALHESAGGEIKLREAGAALLVTAVVLALAVPVLGRGPATTALANLPGSRTAHAYAQTTANQQQRIQYAAQNLLPALSRAARLGLVPAFAHDAAIRSLNLALQRLRQELKQATSRADALRAISATQQELRKIAASLHPITAAGAAQLDRALFAQGLTPARAGGRGAGGRTPGNGSLRAYQTAASALNRLANRISNLGAAAKHGSAGTSARQLAAQQLSALKSALARAAESASNSQLRQALRQAASSLNASATQSAARLLRQAASALNRSGAAREAQARARSAASALDSVKEDITGLGNGGHDGSATTTAPSGLGVALGSGAGTGSVFGVKNGKNHAGSDGKNGYNAPNPAPGKGNTAANKGSGSGLGHGSGPGTGGTGHGGGHGNSGDRGTASARRLASRAQSGNGSAPSPGFVGSANHRGTTGRAGARVYIPPVKTGTSAPTIQLGGQNGAPLPGPTVPYHRVLGRYQDTARAALDQASLPPAVKSYIHQYFTAISR